MSEETLERIRELTEQRAKAQSDLDWADQQWRAFIAAIVKGGRVRVEDVAEAAGVSRARIYQIRDGRR